MVQKDLVMRQSKLKIVIFVKAELFYWFALDVTGIPKKVAECLLLILFLYEYYIELHLKQTVHFSLRVLMVCG